MVENRNVQVSFDLSYFEGLFAVQHMKQITKL